MDKRIGNRKVCFGCGLCMISCKHDVISMQLNSRGFYVPYIKNSQNCTGCGMCLKVCNYKTTDKPIFSQPLSAYAAWNKDNHIRRISSSGGMAFALCSYLMSNGYKICAVKYDSSTSTAKHYISDTLDNLMYSLGSKYLQSDVTQAFKEIDPTKKYAIIGTPCQIDMWRRYLRLIKKEGNFILIDFFCHGIPSYNVWRKYLKEKRFFINTSSEISFRDKKEGWHKSWNICAYKSNNDVMTGNSYYRSTRESNDGFYFMFLSNVALNPACYSDCKYKYLNSSADIRLGDLWGNKFKTNEEGVSAVLTFTERGDKLLNNINAHLEEYPAEVVCEGQMKSCVAKPWYYRIVQKALKAPFIRISFIKKFVIYDEIIKYKISKIRRL